MRVLRKVQLCEHLLQLLMVVLMQGKPFAVFGCGDALRFKNNYADALGEVSGCCCAGASASIRHSLGIRPTCIIT
jgi:hypothetical protein